MMLYAAGVGLPFAALESILGRRKVYGFLDCEVCFSDTDDYLGIFVNYKHSLVCIFKKMTLPVANFESSLCKHLCSL